MYIINIRNNNNNNNNLLSLVGKYVLNLKFNFYSLRVMIQKNIINLLNKNSLHFGLAIKKINC